MGVNQTRTLFLGQELSVRNIVITGETFTGSRGCKREYLQGRVQAVVGLTRCSCNIKGTPGHLPANQADLTAALLVDTATLNGCIPIAVLLPICNGMRCCSEMRVTETSVLNQIHSGHSASRAT